MTAVHDSDSLLALLKARAIPFSFAEHAAVFTTSEAADLPQPLAGAACKNLFLRDKKKTAYFLLVAPASKRTDLVALSDALGRGRLTFASAQDMARCLGVTPGSVTPLAVLNDTACEVSLMIDAELLASSHIVVHPLINTASLSLSVDDLLTLTADHGHPARVIELAGVSHD